MYAAVQSSSSSPSSPPTRFLGIRFPRNVFLRRDGAQRDDGPFVGQNLLAPAVAAATASVSAARGGPLFAATRTRCVCARVVWVNGCRTSVVYTYIRQRSCVCVCMCVQYLIFIHTYNTATPILIHKLYTWWERTTLNMCDGTLCSSPCDHRNIVTLLYCCNNDKCL